MLSRNRNGYTAAEVEAALHSAKRHISFRYELLDSSNQFKVHLDNVLGGRVRHRALNDIKRTARFTLQDDGSINYLSDRIKPYARVRMSDGGYAEFPLGVFILTTPPRKIDRRGVITREVEAYDLGQVLADDKVTERYTVTAGTNYIEAVKTVLDGAGLTDQNLTPTDRTLPADRDWEPGTPKARIINDLLSAINYRALWFDEEGRAVAAPYVSPSDQASEYTYRDDDKSVIVPEAEHSLDLFGIPNQWVLVVSQPDRAVLRSAYTNANPSSPTSTVNRGRTITAPIQYVDAATQEDLDAKAQRVAFEASQVYEKVSFETAIMPFHSHADVFTLEYTPLGVSAKYSETAWEFDLEHGARMLHEVRRVVSV